MEGDESGPTGDWSEKTKNCLTPDERSVVDECYKTKSDAILRDVRPSLSVSYNQQSRTLTRLSLSIDRR